MGIPWYVETDVVSQFPRIPSTTHISCLGSRWVLHYKFEARTAQIEALLYELLALHTLRNSPGINPFIGIVVDRQGGAISGYLSELPIQRQLLIFMRTCLDSGQAIGTQRAERWCRELVQGLAIVHRQGFVIGHLGEILKDGVGLNEHDNVVLYRFQTKFYYNEDRQGLLPPEYYHKAVPGTMIPALPETDIYQLGLFLWRIMTPSHLHVEASWNKTLDCKMKFKNDLKLLREDIPQYIQDIITACRAENPHERPPARELLVKFPIRTEESLEPQSQARAQEEEKTNPALAQEMQDNSTGRPTTSTEARIRKGWAQKWICNLCQEGESETCYICPTCSAGDFGLCINCFSRGNHCRDNMHYLYKMNGNQAEEKYYSSVQVSGQRTILDHR
jgi:serine/threonine protein kinase